MKKVLMCTLVIAVLSIAAISFAGTKASADLADNGESYAEITCPKNTWAVGVGYVEYRQGDSVDAVTVVCRDKNGRETAVEHADFSNSNQSLLKITCPPKEEFIGVYYEDLPRTDTMDAVTVVCKSPQGTHRVANKDLDKAKSGMEVTKSGKERVIGVAYKDLPHSDKVDGVTVITK